VKQDFVNRTDANKTARTPVKDFFNKALFIGSIAVALTVIPAVRSFAQKLLWASYSEKTAVFEFGLGAPGVLEIRKMPYKKDSAIDMNIDISEFTAGASEVTVPSGERPSFVVRKNGVEKTYVLVKRGDAYAIIEQTATGGGIERGRAIEPDKLLNGTGNGTQGGL